MVPNEEGSFFFVVFGQRDAHEEHSDQQSGVGKNRREYLEREGGALDSLDFMVIEDLRHARDPYHVHEQIKYGEHDVFQWHILH